MHTYTWILRPPSCRHPNLKTPLIKAVKDGTKDIWKTKMTRLIDEESADVDEKDKFGKTPLAWAVKRDRLDIVEFLCFKGANIEITYEGHHNCVMFACRYGRLAITEFLITKGANILELSSLGYSCLMFASYKGHLDVVNLLLSKGANMHDLSLGQNCFCFARLFQNYNILDRLRKWPTIMAIIVLKELAVYHHLDAQTIIDLYKYLGRQRIAFQAIWPSRWVAGDDYEADI